MTMLLYNALDINKVLEHFTIIVGILSGKISAKNIELLGCWSSSKFSNFRKIACFFRNNRALSE